MQDVSHEGHDSRPPSVESETPTNKMHRLKPEVDGMNRSNNRAWSPSPMRRSHSPQPYYRDASPLPPRRVHDLGFSEAVSDMVEIVKHETSRRGRARAKLRGDEYNLSNNARVHTPTRRHRMMPSIGMDGDYEHRNYRSASNSPDRFRDDRVSPCPSPLPARLPAIPVKRGYRSATNSLEEHPSRSPTPDHMLLGNQSRGLVKDGSLSQHSYPTLPQRRTGGRKLPPTPRKPSTLNLGVVGTVVLAAQRGNREHTARHRTGVVGPGGNINFPKLSPSPTHPPRTHHLPAIPTGPGGRLPHVPVGHSRSNPTASESEYISRMEPLSFEQALAIGRGTAGGAGVGGGGGRQLPSPMPNGYKPNSGDSGRLGTRRALSQRQGSAGRGIHGDDMRHSDSDEDDWC